MSPAQFNPAVAGRKSRVRWWILALLFFGTTLNMLDRMVLSTIAPDLQKQYSINDIQYGYIQAAFAACYAFSQLGAGPILDHIGMRLGYAVALGGWSIMSMLHALARGTWGFIFVRGLLGVTESPAFPGAAKALAEWFPRRERAFAFGFINAGTNMGVIGASALVPLIAATLGWQWAFLSTGVMGFIVLLFWVKFYRSPAQHPAVSPAELAYIHSDPPEPEFKANWLSLIRQRQAWAFAAGKFLTDSMWWFYLSWFPKYLYSEHHLDLLHLGLPLVTIYLICDLGSVGGGWLSSTLIRRGQSVNRARKTAFFVCALAVMPIAFARSITGLWPTVLLLGLVAAAHQGFSTNLYTIVSDMFPKKAVASVAGFGGTWGYFGAALFQPVVGRCVETWHNYTIPFLCVALAYITAFGCIHWLAPRLEPARLEQA